MMKWVLAFNLCLILFSETIQAEEGPSSTVYFTAWAGNEKINQYISTQSDIFFKKTGIKIVHVKVSEYTSVIKTIEAEKLAGKSKNGTVDVLWINGENFAAMKEKGLLFGPIVPLIENYKYINAKDPSYLTDFNVPVDGMEVPWGKAQFVFIWDQKKTPKPPKSANEFLEFAKGHPNKLSYVKPPHFHGLTFLKQVLSDISIHRSDLQKDCKKVDLESLSKPLWTYLDALHPHLWRKGKTFPLSVQAMNQMLLDGELLLSMSFNPLESDSLVLKKEIPKTAVSTTFTSGGIGNVHFLSIPFNSKNTQAAIKWINHLVSVEAQQAKSDIQLWGDPTVLDLEKLKPEERKLFPRITLKGPLMSEPHACWMEYLKDEWIKRYGTGS